MRIINSIRDWVAHASQKPGQGYLWPPPGLVRNLSWLDELREWGERAGVAVNLKEVATNPDYPGRVYHVVEMVRQQEAVHINAGWSPERRPRYFIFFTIVDLKQDSRLCREIVNYLVSIGCTGKDNFDWLALYASHDKEGDS